jgi:hypothetical protein
MSKKRDENWVQTIFNESDRLAWNREYARNKRKDPYFRKDKRMRNNDKVNILRDELRKDGCILCGYIKCSAALEFHHVGDDKEGELSKIRSTGSFMREAAKCIVVCANCHREIHAGQIEGYENVQRAVPVADEPPLLRLIKGS